MQMVVAHVRACAKKKGQLTTNVKSIFKNSNKNNKKCHNKANTMQKEATENITTKLKDYS